MREDENGWEDRYDLIQTLMLACLYTSREHNGKGE